MTDKEWLASDEAKEKNMRFYAHFDYRTNIGQQRVYLSDPKNIKLHGFYPFIHYKQKQTERQIKSGIFAMLHTLTAVYISIITLF